MVYLHTALVSVAPRSCDQLKTKDIDVMSLPNAVYHRGFSKSNIISDSIP